jgi:hypothetical protein
VPLLRPEISEFGEGKICKETTIIDGKNPAFNPLKKS